MKGLLFTFRLCECQVHIDYNGSAKVLGRTSADVVALRTSSSIKSHGSISRFGHGDPATTSCHPIFFRALQGPRR